MNASSAFFRCVCGEQIVLPHGGLNDALCPTCGRRHPATAFALADAATITLDGGSIPRAAGQHGTILEGGGTPDTEGGDDDPRLHATLHHFRLLDRLAAGGMGVIYRALDESLERYVAIKVLHHGQTSSDRVSHLLQEAVAQARINHPHVVHIYYVGRDPSSPFLAMELVEGGALNDLMSHRSLTFHETARMGLQLAQAMQQASALGIVHGDIKPNNVLLDREQQVKLTDFGLALVDSREEGRRIAGTPQYMAPEMWSGEISAASDMYALGVTLFEMTFGRRPLNPPEGASTSEIATMHRTQPVEFPQPWPVDVPLIWGDILERLLAKSPAERYPSYDQLVTDLQAAQPIDRPVAGKVPRALAWIVDMAIMQLPLGLFQPGFALIPSSNLFGRAAIGIAGFALMFLLVLGCSRWGRTPGKALFQLRVVDRYGLKPSDFSFFLRGLWVMTLVWMNWLVQTMIALGLSPPLGGSQFWFIVLLQVALVVDAISTLFLKRRQSIHDRLLHTEVVLDSAVN